MSTCRQIFYQIVFGTKNREATLSETHENELYKYIWGIINEQKCKLYRVNSMPNHIHIFSDLHPPICLRDFVKNIKVASNIWMKNSRKFPTVLWLAGCLCSLYVFNQGKGYDRRIFKKSKGAS